MLLTPLFTPPIDTAKGAERPTVQLVDIYYSADGYSFDFSKLDRFIKLALDSKIEYFEFPHLFTQWGSEHAPKIIVTENGKSYRRFGWETNSDSPEYAEFLQSFLPAFKSFMKEKSFWIIACFIFQMSLTKSILKATEKRYRPFFRC